MKKIFSILIIVCMGFGIDFDYYERAKAYWSPNPETGKFDSGWMAKNGMGKAPKEWIANIERQLSDPNPLGWGMSAYRRRRPNDPPYYLRMDLLFFYDFDKYIYYESSRRWKLWIYATMPFRVIWHGSSLLYMDNFNYRYREYHDMHALSPWAPMVYKQGEMKYRLFIIWIFIPFVILLYWTVILTIKRLIYGTDDPLDYI